MVIHMIKNETELKKIYGDYYDDEQYTTNGIDYRLKDVSILVEKTQSTNTELKYIGIVDNKKTLPNYIPLQDSDGIYHFRAGRYYIWDLGKHQIPDDAIAMFWLRSTIMRCGGVLNSSVADRGFNGTISVGFYCHNNVSISKNERVVQAVFFNSNDDGNTYDGDYQEE